MMKVAGTMRAAVMMFGAMLMAMPALGAPPPAADKSDVENAADKQNKMICKRFADTGSLVTTRKVCKTKHDWDVARAELRQNVMPGQCAGGDGGICN